MSQVLTVPTHFNDIGELSEGFLDRVESDTLILYGPVAYEDGSEIEFAVLLADGSAALEGAGRVRAAVDGGADRVADTRYDIVFEALQFDGRNEVVFESLVLARQTVSDRPFDDEPVAEEIELAAFDDAYDDDEGESATVIAKVDAEALTAAAVDSEYAFEHGIAREPRVGMPVPIPSMAAPPEAPPAPPTLRLAEPPEGLTRPSLARIEESAFTTDDEVSDVHATGLFAYEADLPIPSRPPLPDPAGPRRAPRVEATAGYDVEESEPPSADDEEYEEVRLSDFAGAIEEG